MSCVLAPAYQDLSVEAGAFLHSHCKKGGWHVSAAVDINVDPPDCSTAARAGHGGGGAGA